MTASAARLAEGSLSSSLPTVAELLAHFEAANALGAVALPLTLPATEGAEGEIGPEIGPENRPENRPKNRPPYGDDYKLEDFIRLALVAFPDISQPQAAEVGWALEGLRDALRNVPANLRWDGLLQLIEDLA